MSHSKTVCKHCATVITQCRCMSPDKTITYSVCHKCKDIPEPKVETKKKFQVTSYVELKDEKYCNGCKFLNLDWEGYTYSWCHFVKRIRKDEFGLKAIRPDNCPLEVDSE